MNTQKKSKIVINWPSTSYFTLNDVFNLNPDRKTITVRVHLSKLIEDSKAVEIGYIPGGKGRPCKVFAMTPVSKMILDRAEAAEIHLVEKAREKFVNVVSITNSLTSAVVNVSPLDMVKV